MGWDTIKVADFAERTRLLSLDHLREDYRRAEFDEKNCRTNPFDQFQDWFKDAQVAHLKEPNAMALATATLDGKPSSRIVLLKEVNSNGFVFYTNYASRKARELETNPYCAATFVWLELERQVRVEGKVSKITQKNSAEYFKGRPKGSKLGALASDQSATIPDRQVLVERLAELESEYAGTDDVPMPEHWGGFCIVPCLMEFWQGRTNRLHDRLLYSLIGESWKISRLAP
jgi:pyridoxamine 5'-phosphate oxidase